MTLPQCEYRITTSEPNEYYCRSTLVHSKDNFVSSIMCRGCDLHSQECDVLPLPSPHLLDKGRVGVFPPVPGTWCWAYGVTVAPRRIPTLGRTLESLLQAGFPEPHLFVDGDADFPSDYSVTRRDPKIGAWPNWILAAHELYQREPLATAYAIFQDDILLAKQVRQFLERIEWPGDGYFNLYTSHQNGRGEAWFRAPE